MDNEISFTFLVKQEIASQEFEENKIKFEMTLKKEKLFKKLV